MGEFAWLSWLEPGDWKSGSVQHHLGTWLDSQQHHSLHLQGHGYCRERAELGEPPPAIVFGSCCHDLSEGRDPASFISVLPHSALHVATHVYVP